MTTAPSPNLVGLAGASDEIVLTLPRRFDVHAVPDQRTTLRQLDLGPGDRVAFDASLVRHVDRAGLAFLAEATGLAHSVGAVIALTNISLAMEITMELTGRRGLPSGRRTPLVDLDAEAA